jgi:sulfur dioxygenase
LTPHWVEEHLRELQVVDVREPDEFSGPLGHIPGARLIPLGGFAEAAAGLARDKPIVTVCRAGGRSAQAFMTLKRLGFAHVANLPGGMLGWRALRQVVEGGNE